ncbi:MAG TPA: alpha/beta hydrolase [Actinomycetes bacterium]|nr:alpha/beta hydrolase [Actinomycetes bacterium]
MNHLAGLDYDERGAGEVVCLVHAGVFGAWFAPLFEQPALDGFRVIRPIRPGYGHSPAPSEPASIAAHARQCGALLRALGVARAHWVGHSSSCCIGLQLALDDPGLVASLTLFEPAKPSGEQREVAASSYVGPALAAAAQGDIARAFDVFLRGVGGDGYRKVLRARFGDDGLVEAERESAYFFADELPAVAAWTFGPAEAARVAAPALLLCGAESRPWFRENVAILAEMLPDVRTQILPALDHLAPLTHPAELASSISEFVRHPAATPS